MRFAAVVCCVLLALFLQVGCAKDERPETVTMAGGRVEGLVRAPVAKTTEAARAALTESNLQVVQYSVSNSRGRVVAYMENRERIEIDILPSEQEVGSSVAMRTEGRAGEQVSLAILKKIRQKI